MSLEQVEIAGGSPHILMICILSAVRTCEVEVMLQGACIVEEAYGSSHEVTCYGQLPVGQDGYRLPRGANLHPD